MDWRNLSKTAEKSSSSPRAAGVYLEELMLVREAHTGLTWRKVVEEAHTGLISLSVVHLSVSPKYQNT
jgi:hypothetical protein